MCDQPRAADPSVLLSALQLGDSLFPSGRYTLSHGLESFVEQGRLRSAAELEALLADYLEWAVGRSEAVAVAAASRGAAAGDLDTVVEADRLLLAMKLPAEAAAASTRTGRTLLAACRRLDPGEELLEYARRVEEGSAPGNHAVAFGVVAATWGIAPREAVLVELYAYTASLLGAALRTIRLDHTDAQAILRRSLPAMTRIAEAAVRTPHEEMSAFAPAIEIMQMSHERSHARLFAS